MVTVTKGGRDFIQAWCLLFPATLNSMVLKVSWGSLGCYRDACHAREVCGLFCTLNGESWKQLMNRILWEVMRRLPVGRGSKQRQDKLQERRLRHKYVSRPEDTESFPKLGYLFIYILRFIYYYCVECRGGRRMCHSRACWDQKMILWSRCLLHLCVGSGDKFRSISLQLKRLYHWSHLAGPHTKSLRVHENARREQILMQNSVCNGSCTLWWNLDPVWHWLLPVPSCRFHGTVANRHQDVIKTEPCYQFSDVAACDPIKQRMSPARLPPSSLPPSPTLCVGLLSLLISLAMRNNAQ